jgi:hypothetical protein
VTPPVYAHALKAEELETTDVISNAAKKTLAPLACQKVSGQKDVRS